MRRPVALALVGASVAGAALLWASWPKAPPPGPGVQMALFDPDNWPTAPATSSPSATPTTTPTAGADGLLHQPDVLFQTVVPTADKNAQMIFALQTALANPTPADWSGYGGTLMDVFAADDPGAEEWFVTKAQFGAMMAGAIATGTATVTPTSGGPATSTPQPTKFPLPVVQGFFEPARGLGITLNTYRALFLITYANEVYPRPTPYDLSPFGVHPLPLPHLPTPEGGMTQFRPLLLQVVAERTPGPLTISSVGISRTGYHETARILQEDYGLGMYYVIR